MFKFIQPERAKCSIRLMRNSAKCSMQLIRFSRYLIEEFCELSVLYHENFAFKSKGSTRIQRKHAKNAFFAIKSMHLGPFSRYFEVILACFACSFATKLVRFVRDQGAEIRDQGRKELKERGDRIPGFLAPGGVPQWTGTLFFSWRFAIRGAN